MALTFAQIETLLIPAAHELLQDNMRRYVNQNKYNWYTRCIDVKITDAWENEFNSMISTRLWPEYHEGDPLNITHFDDGDRAVFTLHEYQDGFPVTREYLKYGDAYTAVEHIFPRLATRMQQFMERGLLRHSQQSSIILLDAFNGTFHLGLDTLPLCSNVHTLPDGTTFDNKSGLPLSEAALDVAFAGMSEITDAEGVPLDINYDTIITGPSLKPTVDRIISNTVKPGATNNEKNLWNGLITKHVICPWLINKVQAGAADYWFLQDSNTHTLKGFVGEYPTVLPEAKIDPMVMNVVAVTSGVYGWFDWRGMFGSDGGS
jgi:hypothetical protein